MQRSAASDRTSSPALSPARPTSRPTAWFVVDVVLILVFAISGRSTHERGLSVAGILDTAWPFLAAYATAVLVVRAWRSPSSPYPTGLALWAITAVGGLMLRALSGGGTAAGFQVVTLLVLGVFLLLPRLTATIAPYRRSRRVA